MIRGDTLRRRTEVKVEITNNSPGLRGSKQVTKMLRILLATAMVASSMAFAPMGGVLPRHKVARGATGKSLFFFGSIFFHVCSVEAVSIRIVGKMCPENSLQVSGSSKRYHCAFQKCKGASLEWTKIETCLGGALRR